jgi:glycoprotein endo-alpha-1,2-mannosidase
MAQWARDNNKIFIPSVGPGYDDTRVRPWNFINRRDRENGAYYDRMFQAAININPDIISITSFNEWHEGTQIEHADPNKVSPDGYDYIDYQPYPDTFYLYKTLYWSNTYIKNSSHLKGLTIKEKFMPSVGSVMPKNTSIYRFPFKNILYTWNANYVGLKP